MSAPIIRKSGTVTEYAPDTVPPPTARKSVPGDTVVTETAFGQSSSPGVAFDYSRKDHTHGTPAAPTIPSAASTVTAETSYGQASSAGVASTYARGDHTHGTPAAVSVPSAASTVASETSFGISPAVGVATAYARSDHTHGTPAAPTIPAAADTVVTETAFGQASSAGDAATFSRSNHTHGTPAAPTIPSASSTVASETSYGVTPFAGEATTYARGDHTHGSPSAPVIPVAADTVVTETGYAQSSAAGTAATFSRSDHTHGTPIVISDTYHGIEASGALSISGSIVTMASGTNTYWYQGSKYTTSSAITCDLDSDSVKDTGSGTKLQTNKMYYLYFRDSSGVLYWSTNVWSLKTKVPVCSVYWNGSAGAVCKETHNHTRNIDWHINSHLTIGARYYSGLDLTKPTTTNDASLELTDGVIYDEDIAITITNALSQISRIWYPVSAGVYTWVNSALPYAGSSGDPKYATGTDLASVNNAKFVAMWVYATSDVDRPIYIFPSTSEETTIAATRALTPPILAGMGITPEIKLIYKFIFRGDGEFQEAADYRVSSSLPSGFVASTAASGVSFVPSHGLSSTNVQAALVELNSAVHQYPLDLADSSYSGPTAVVTIKAGETPAMGKALCMDSSGEWVVASNPTSLNDPVLALALGTGTGAQTVLMPGGWLKRTALSLSAGSLWLGTTGALTTTQPSTSGKKIQFLGVCLGSSLIYFNPSPTIVQIAE